jgi:hypothetical protein
MPRKMSWPVPVAIDLYNTGLNKLQQQVPRKVAYWRQRGAQLEHYGMCSAFAEGSEARNFGISEAQEQAPNNVLPIAFDNDVPIKVPLEPFGALQYRGTFSDRSGPTNTLRID